MINLETLIGEIPRIGIIYQKRLKKLGIKTVQDLLFYFPNRYDDFSNIIPVKKVKLGYVVCVQGKILEIKNIKTFKNFMDITEIAVEDETGSIKALWFNQPYLAKTLKEDDFICLAGKVSLGKDGIYLNNPAYERIGEFAQNNSDFIENARQGRHNLTHTGRIIPVYSETKGVSSRWLRFVIKPLLSNFYDKIPEILPIEIIKKYKFLPIKRAIWQAHFPDSFEYADAAKARFSFEELFLLQIHVLKEKAKLMTKQAPACPMDPELMKEFTKSLPFLLTDSQKQSAYQILKDLEKSVPMYRLLEGDVGSGKTVVATMCALSSVKNGCQVAFMAPTEILAKQHFKKITELLNNFNVKIGLMTSKENRIYKPARNASPTSNASPARQPDGSLGGGRSDAGWHSDAGGEKIDAVSKRSLLEDLKNGQIDILIGTHALIQKGVEFKNLAFVIVDEQHRFGVEQRSQLMKNNKLAPHLLSMTATPIPRTLALTIYGDLDLSLIKEMPKNRKKIKTLIIESKNRKSAYEFIRKEAKEGKGIFVICPKIEPKNAIKNNEQTYGSFAPRPGVSASRETLAKLQNYNFSNFALQDIKAVKEEYEKLSKEIFPDLRITMLHGKLKPKEKERIMLDFQKGEIDILVSTSVVEVGVDVTRATVMMIEGAERFGLAQLHQFRGRVGRSDMQSYCFLFTTLPDQLNRKRLKALVDSNNGFELAQKDLEIRGPGQVYGTRQWGLPDIAMQGLSNIFLVEKTRAAAKEILEKDPELKNYPLLKERVKQFEIKIHFE